MFVPLIIGLFAGLAGYAVGLSKRADPPRALVDNTATFPGQKQITSGAVRKPVSHVGMLNHRLDRGAPISADLVKLALIECHRSDDMAMFRLIAKTFLKAPAAQESKPDDSEESEGNGETETVVKKSPIDGVSDGEWEDFVSKLRVRDTGYATPQHLGAYEHNRQRLKALGYESELSTDEEQYEALVTDITDHYENAKPLIDEFSGDVIEDHPITMSGILALLKAGGVQGANQWLRDPAARTKYPRTKELFLRANGCF